MKEQRFQKCYSLGDFNESEEHLVESHILGSTSLLIYRSDGTRRTYIIDGLSGHYLLLMEKV